MSTPSHVPCWIKPGVLIARLACYIKTPKSVNEIDLQIAVSRCVPEYDADIAKQIDEQLDGEMNALMHFLLDENAAPVEPFHHKASWMTALLTRKNKKSWPAFQTFSYARNPIGYYSGDLDWQTLEEIYKTTKYDYQLRNQLR